MSLSIPPLGSRPRDFLKSIKMQILSDSTARRIQNVSLKESIQTGNLYRWSFYICVTPEQKTSFILTDSIVISPRF